MSLSRLSSFAARATAGVPPLMPVMRLVAVVALAASVSACSVLAVADAAVTVAATAVSVTATVVETTVDVAAAGVRAVTADDKDPKKVEERKAEEKPGPDPRQESAPETATAPQRTWQAPEWPVNR